MLHLSNVTFCHLNFGLINCFPEFPYANCNITEDCVEGSRIGEGSRVTPQFQCVCQFRSSQFDDHLMTDIMEIM